MFTRLVQGWCQVSWLSEQCCSRPPACVCLPLYRSASVIQCRRGWGFGRWASVNGLSSYGSCLLNILVYIAVRCRYKYIFPLCSASVGYCHMHIMGVERDGERESNIFPDSEPRMWDVHVNAVRQSSWWPRASRAVSLLLRGVWFGVERYVTLYVILQLLYLVPLLEAGLAGLDPLRDAPSVFPWPFLRDLKGHFDCVIC